MPKNQFSKITSILDSSVSYNKNKRIFPQLDKTKNSYQRTVGHRFNGKIFRSIHLQSWEKTKDTAITTIFALSSEGLPTSPGKRMK